MPRTENKFQQALIKRLQDMFPGCLVLKNDEQYISGIPDLTVLYGPHCALLEVKRSEEEMYSSDPRVVTQAHYLSEVTQLGGNAYFIYPENEREVLDALQYAFEPSR